MRILIAEDDAISRRMLERLLRKWGYDVLSLADGQAALDALRHEEGPQLAILDWMMPGCDGLEVCRGIRAAQSEDHYVYIILLTARTGQEDLVAGMDAGADDYVVKPFDSHELRVRVRAGQRITELHEELLRTKRALEYQAVHDPLTGALNRRAVHTRLEAELARAARQDMPLSLAMVDFDHFKSINDTHGHAAGDAVLCEFVARVEANTRKYDILGRWGGEEFLVVMPGIDGARAPWPFERLRQAITARPVEFEGKLLPVTVSIGAAIAHDSRPDKLIDRADRALYKAKEQGRNRVVYADIP